MYDSLAGKRALVLGGSRGIGRAIALRLAGEGCHVLLTYSRSREPAEATAEECRALGVEAEALRSDAGKPEELAALLQRAREGGGLDILVNNAARGLERPRPAIEQRPGHLHRAMDVNLFGPWRAAQLAVPLLEEGGGGAIVNLLSPGAHHYMAGYAAVGVSKAALESLTLYLAVELAPRGVRVNGVSAGWVEGADGERTVRAAVSDRVRPYVPAGRNVAPEDVAAAVAWACSDEAAMLVGHTLHIDGGFGHAAWRAVLDPIAPADGDAQG
jgi:enoyl-[acyl-carrier protein] reductase III